MRYISLSTLFGVSFGAQSWDPKLVVLRPQVLASSRRSKSHHTIGMITTHFGLYKWSVWGTPFIQSNFLPRGLVSGRDRKLGASSVIIKNRAAPNLRSPPQMKRFLFKNDYAVFATVIASFLNDFGVLYDVRVPVVFLKENLKPRCSQR